MYLDLKGNKDTTLLSVSEATAVVAYGSETWKLTKADERSLGIFEKKDSQIHFWGCSGKRSMEKKIQL